MSATFKGETITINIGYPAGGAPDLYFRVLQALWTPYAGQSNHRSQEHAGRGHAAGGKLHL